MSDRRPAARGWRVSHRDEPRRYAVCDEDGCSFDTYRSEAAAIEATYLEAAYRAAQQALETHHSHWATDDQGCDP